MSKIINFSNAVFSIECIVASDTPWFKGKEIATILGYANTMQAIRTNIDEDDRKKMEELRQLPDSSPDHNAKNTVYINDQVSTA